MNNKKDGVKMKFRKSTLSILLIMTLLISTISSTLAFATVTVDYTGAVSRMKQLEIFDASAGNASAFMTRGQFAKALVIADDLVDVASEAEGSTVFADVQAYSNLSGYVNILINKQLISGMADGKFHPEASITYPEICTAVIRLLGYIDSDLKGTWPSNYLGKAQSLKITDNLALKKSDKVTIGATAVMLDRLLGTNVKNISTNGADDVIFSDSLNLNPDYAEYIILGNSKTSDNLGDNEVLTDKGILTYKNGVDYLEIGAKYQLYVDTNVITDIYKKENSTENYVVTEKIGINMKWQNDKDEVKSMDLPKATVYYYHGKKVNYNAAVAAINAFSSIVLTKNSMYNLVNLDGVFLANSQEAIWQLYPTANSNARDGSTFILTSTPSFVSLRSSFALNGFELNDKRQTSWVKSFTNTTGTYYYPFKYKIQSSTTPTEYTTILRLAEQYLIRAEASGYYGHADPSNASY